MKNRSHRIPRILPQSIKNAPHALLPLVSCLLILASPAFAILDENENGLSDLWEKRFNEGVLFSSDFDPQADVDGDGWTNAQEAAAGTDPFNANPPTGYTPCSVQYIQPVTYDDDDDGIPDRVGETYARLTWSTMGGKRYRVFVNPELTGTWFELDPGYPLMGDGELEEWTVTISQEDGSVPDRLFWRVAIDDEDSDGDSLTDAEEYELGTSSYSSDTDDDSVSDYDEIRAGADPRFPQIRNFARLHNADGTVNYTWDSNAANGDWFHINELQPDGTWKVVFATTYGSAHLPYVQGETHYVITLDPATDFLP